VRKLVELGGGAAEALRRALESDDPEVRAGAREALDRIGRGRDD